MTWEEQAKQKRDSVFSQIPKEWVLDHDIIPSPKDERNAIKILDSLLPSNEIEITSQSVLSLADKIQKGQLTSLEVVKAFAHRAAYTHQIINNLAEIFFERAFERAKELDEYYKKTGGKTIGPLHGIPISLKDQVNLEGLDSAIGYVGLTNKPKTKDEVSVIANILYDQGAVFYVKTTVPMAMMAADTVSNIYGQTVNAHNRLLSPGGSSGGESSLIAAKGALIGLSTDIGGSIRIPAAFNGLFALRGTSNRLPYAKVTNSMADQTIVPSVIGPSATYLDDLKFFVKLIIDSKPWLKDPKVPPIPWREYEVPSKLTIGILSNNGTITPHPPIQRAIELTKQKLISLGHDVVDWEPPVGIEEIGNELFGIFTADGYDEVKRTCAISGEPPIKQLLGFSEDLKSDSLTEYWERTARKYKAQQKYDEYWLETAKSTKTGRPVDAWISPVYESTSYPAGQVSTYPVTYTLAVNYIDLPSVVVPITFADKSIDKPIENFQPLSEGDKEAFKLYDAELFDKMPVALQLITPRYEEERAIALAEVLYKATH